MGSLLTKGYNEIVQRHAACWVKSDYNYNSSVSAMLANLQWPSLQHRRYITRLKLFYHVPRLVVVHNRDHPLVLLLEGLPESTRSSQA